MCYQVQITEDAVDYQHAQRKCILFSVLFLHLSSATIEAPCMDVTLAQCLIGKPIEKKNNYVTYSMWNNMNPHLQ